MNLGQVLTIVLGVDLKDLKAGLTAAKQQVVDFSAKVNQTGQSIAEAGASSISGWSTFNATLAPIKENMNEILMTANRMSLTAMRTILAGGAALAIAYFPTKEAVEFEKQMAMIAGVTKASSDQMQNMRDVAVQMGRETVFSATQAAQAMTILSKSGFSVSEVITMLPSTMQLAAAGELTMAEAADVASNAIHGFRLNASEMSHVADVMALAATSTNINVKNMAESLKMVAPAATAAGMGVNETAAALEVLANAGI